MCSNKTRFLVGFLNMLFLGLGIAVVAIAAWGVNHISAFEGLLHGGTIRTAVAAGALLIVVSAFGFFGAILVEHKFGRFLLILYNILIFALIALTLAGAGLVIVFANKVKDAKLDGNVDNSVNQSVYKLWSKCCQSNTLVKDCPLYDFFSQSDCTSYNTFFARFKDFVKTNFGAIAGILFGAAALQFITSIMVCVTIRRGRAAQHKREAEEKQQQHVHHGQPVPAQGAYAPPVPQPHYNQPHVAQDHRF